MSMTSFAFILFAAVTVLLYYVAPKRAQWVVLLVASGIFYAAAGGWYLPFIGVTVLSTYLLARLIARMSARDEAYLAAHRVDIPKEERKAYKAQGKKRRFLVLIVGLVFNFGILAVLNLDGENRPVTATICGEQVDGFEAEEYALYEHYSKEMRILKRGQKLDITLENSDDVRLYILAPLDGGNGFIGRPDQFISPKADPTSGICAYIENRQLVLRSLR